MRLSPQISKSRARSLLLEWKKPGRLGYKRHLRVHKVGMKYEVQGYSSDSKKGSE